MLRRVFWCSTPLAALCCCVATFSAAPAPQTRNFDWPQWQGQDRTAVSQETGLLKEWPKEGPPLAWKLDTLGGGYSTPSIAAGRIFGMSYRGEDEVVWALDEATGKELWSTRIATANRKVGYGEGSRCTPTVDGEVLYALGVSGDLVCLKTASGDEVWHKNLLKDFGGKVGGWKYAESPLIDGDKLLCTPGGKKATLLALNKKTAETIWMAPVVVLWSTPMVTPMPELFTTWKKSCSDSPACAVKVCVPVAPVMVIELDCVKNEPCADAPSAADASSAMLEGSGIASAVMLSTPSTPAMATDSSGSGV